MYGATVKTIKMESGVITPFIIDLVLDGGEWLSCPDHFFPWG